MKRSDLETGQPYAFRARREVRQVTMLRSGRKAGRVIVRFEEGLTAGSEKEVLCAQLRCPWAERDSLPDIDAEEQTEETSPLARVHDGRLVLDEQHMRDIRAGRQPRLRLDEDPGQIAGQEVHLIEDVLWLVVTGVSFVKGKREWVVGWRLVDYRPRMLRQSPGGHVESSANLNEYGEPPLPTKGEIDRAREIGSYTSALSLAIRDEPDAIPERIQTTYAKEAQERDQERWITERQIIRSSIGRLMDEPGFRRHGSTFALLERMLDEVGRKVKRAA